MQIYLLRLMKSYGLEFALLASMVCLCAQLCWTPLARAWHAPRAGQAGIAYLIGDPPPGIGAAFHARLPTGYTAERKWPLIVHLHGSGDSNKAEFERRETGPIRAQCAVDVPAVIVSPVCVGNAGWQPDSVDAFVSRMLDRYSIDERRIYLVGYSMGGYGTWRTAAAYPERFAAVAPIAGGGDPDTAGRLINLPIWAFHGERDRVVSANATREMVEALRAAGGEPRVTFYPGAGHGISQTPYSEQKFWEWLLNQSLPASQEP